MRHETESAMSHVTIKRKGVNKNEANKREIMNIERKDAERRHERDKQRGMQTEKRSK
jgi:hypothetical protein